MNEHRMLKFFFFREDLSTIEKKIARLKGVEKHISLHFGLTLPATIAWYYDSARGDIIGLYFAIMVFFPWVAKNVLKFSLAEQLRSQDTQDFAIYYGLDLRALRTLALRYGIVNFITDDDGHNYSNANNDLSEVQRLNFEIRAKKSRHINGAQYLAELPDHRDCKVAIRCPKGSADIEEFLPLADEWFDRNQQIEKALHLDTEYSVTDLAKLHIEKAIN